MRICEHQTEGSEMSSAATATAIARSDVDPYSDKFLADPHPGFRALRELGPVVYLPVHDAFALPRYAEVRAALTDWQHFSNLSGVGLNDGVNASRGLLHMDPPEHTEERALLFPPMSTRGLQDVSREIETTARALADDIVKRGRFDGVRDLAQVIPMVVVAKLVGLPAAGRDHMLEWGAYAFDSLGPLNERSAQAAVGLDGLRQYLESEVSPETVVPGSWAAYVFERAEEQSFSMEAAKERILVYVVPSLDTTIAAMANAIWLFGNHPEQWDLLRERPELLNRAINEVLRFESPVQIFTRRIAGGDHDFADTKLPNGARVLVMFASANRDERKWDEPERFDITREGVSEHLAFGFGEHLCMGQGLARLEIRELLKALIPRVERFEIGDYERRINNTVRSFSSMEVRAR
jgi:cytochrome P450